MRNVWKFVIVLILASAVVAVVMLKKAENKKLPKPITTSVTKKAYEANDVNVSAVAPIEPNNAPLVMTVKVVEPVPAAGPAELKKLPRMIELGSDKCIPCKMMAPIIKELTNEYKGKLQVDFIDVWKNPGEGKKYNLKVIPTQVFLNAEGTELFRHEGFFSREDILAKWKKLGFEFKEKD